MYKQVQIKIRNISVNQPHSFSHIVVGWGFLSAWLGDWFSPACLEKSIHSWGFSQCTVCPGMAERGLGHLLCYSLKNKHSRLLTAHWLYQLDRAKEQLICRVIFFIPQPSKSCLSAPWFTTQQDFLCSGSHYVWQLLTAKVRCWANLVLIAAELQPLHRWVSKEPESTAFSQRYHLAGHIQGLEDEATCTQGSAQFYVGTVIICFFWYEPMALEDRYQKD